MIARYIEPPEAGWKGLCKRMTTGNEDIEQVVSEIFGNIRDGGDDALMRIENYFDHTGYVTDWEMEVQDPEVAEAEAAVSPELKEAIRLALTNILAFHEAQIPAEVRVETAPGVTCIQRPVPIRRVGLYVPGGRAPLFSTVLMLAVPACVAECDEIILCTPPDTGGKADPAVVYAAKLCGVDKIYKIGGAQAIAAMACGTESIKKCDKIVGPGNRYVTKAKQMASLADVAIDMPAGPSEVMVLADETAVPEYVAADFLSQCEHGPDSQAILVCTTAGIADKVEEAIAVQTRDLVRKEIVGEALKNSRIIVLEDRDDIIGFANAYAPEHLIISMSEPWEIADGIVAAGSVFIGNYSPESAGDYASGTNHTLPTGGWARSFSGLNVESFMRKMTIQEITPEGLKGIGKAIRTMAAAEGLDAHAAAVAVRLAAPKPAGASEK